MAVFFGSLIGYERRSSDRPAGIRTMALVSLGSALFTINSTFGFLSGPMVSHAQFCSKHCLGNTSSMDCNLSVVGFDSFERIIPNNSASF